MKKIIIGLILGLLLSFAVKSYADYTWVRLIDVQDTLSEQHGIFFDKVERVNCYWVKVFSSGNIAISCLNAK